MNVMRKIPSQSSIIKITEKEELENDIERIKRKFNFNNINIKQGALIEETNSSLQNFQIKVGEENKEYSLKILHKQEKPKIIGKPASRQIAINDNVYPCTSSSFHCAQNSNSNAASKIKKLESKKVPAAVAVMQNHKKSKSNLPVNINNVVNIINNNYNNIIGISKEIPIATAKESTQLQDKKPTYKSKISGDAKSFKSSTTSMNNISPNCVNCELETERQTKSRGMIVQGQQQADFVFSDMEQSESPNSSLKDLERFNSNFMGLKRPMSKDSKIPSDDENTNNLAREIYKENVKRVGGFDIDSVERKPANSTNSNEAERYGSYVKKNIFSSNPIYNLSNRLLNDEYKHHRTIAKESGCKFIGNVREEIQKRVVFKIRSFLKLSAYSMYNILAFIFNQYDELLYANKFLRKKIVLSLNSLFSKCINEFREKYKEVIELQEFYFKSKVFKKQKCVYPLLDLVLKSKIITTEINSCNEITYSILVGAQDFIQTWKFDIRKKSEIGFWFASEAEEYNHNIIRHCYYQPISSFCKDDMIEFRINLFSYNGIINPDSITWYDRIATQAPICTVVDYEKSLIKSNLQYDRLRFCELENMIHVWKNEKSLTKKQNIDEFKKYFQKHFKINEVMYDISKFFIFKFKMQATSVGIIKSNKFVNFDIEILPYSASVTNESQCLGLLNTNHFAEKIQIRVSTSVLFYVTDLYIYY